MISRLIFPYFKKIIWYSHSIYLFAAQKYQYASFHVYLLLYLSDNACKVIGDTACMFLGAKCLNLPLLI